MSGSESQYFLLPSQSDLLVAALASNQPSTSLKNASRRTEAPGSSDQVEDDTVLRRHIGDEDNTNEYFDASPQSITTLGNLGMNDDSPYLSFDMDAEADDQFDFDNNGQLSGDFPGESAQYDPNDLHEKRKGISDGEDDNEGGGKRRESEGGSGKKPGRKPLTAEPTTKRKAQNRAAQRAFRERKEKHLKDLETKVEDLEKASEIANQENALLRAQVERHQVELKEYRKRLSWISNSGLNNNLPSPRSGAPGAAARDSFNQNGNNFQFEFPRFGDPPRNQASGDSNSDSKNIRVNISNRSATLPTKSSNFGVPGVVGRNSLSGPSPIRSTSNHTSTRNSPQNATNASPPIRSDQTFTGDSSFDSFSALFGPEILEASRQPLRGYFPQTLATTSHQVSQKNPDQKSPGPNAREYSTSSTSQTDSPASSYESHQNGSPTGTSPEPSLNSPGQKVTDYGLRTVGEENQTRNVTDSVNTPALDPNSFNWFAQQNGGGFDPVLFGDFRESQDAFASQDFGAFFNDAFPLPELGSPEHNFNEIAPSPARADLMTQVEAAQDGKEEVVADQDTSKMIPCNKIWDRLQSMEKFRNGEIDLENLCSDFRAKAQCSEGNTVFHQKDVEKLLGSAL